VANWFPKHWASGNAVLAAGLRATSSAMLVCDADVTSIDDLGQAVRVSFRRNHTSTSVQAQVAIVATPADVARRLIGDRPETPASNVLERTRYGRWTVVAFAIRDAAVISPFRFLFDLDAAAMSFVMQQRSADRARAALLCYFNDAATGALDGLDDLDAIDCARRDLVSAGVGPAQLFADATGDIRRWRHGGTIVSTEFLRAARRASPRVSDRVILAGDYIAMTEGWGYGLHDAVISGRRAADIALRILNDSRAR
jgi:hypothetical protein